MKKLFVLFGLLATVSPLVAQSSQQSSKSGKTIAEKEVERLLPKVAKTDLRYIAYGWKRRDEAQRRFAEEEAAANAENPQRALHLLTAAAARDIRTLTRQETLRCLVALHSQPSLPYPDRITPAVLVRSDRWSKDYSATEYKWRTLAQRTLNPSLDLLPALDRLAKASPKDWRVQMVRATLLHRNGRGAQGLAIVRRLAMDYPEHLGTQVSLAWFLRNVATRRADRTMLNEATRVLDRASKLPGSLADKRAYQKEREKNEFRQKNGFANSD